MAKFYAVFQYYICTANEDGSIPLNAKAVARLLDTPDLGALRELIEQANEYARLQKPPKE